MADALPSYGSLKVSTTATTTAEEDPSESDFQEVDTYYLKPSPLSRSEKLKKLLVIGVPILAAVIIVGGAASLLFKDFDHLYPGPGGSVRPYPSPSSNVVKDKGTDTEPSAPSYPVVLPPRGPPLQPASSPKNSPQTGGDRRSPLSSGGGGGRSSSSSSSSSLSGSAACAGHKECSELDLIGDCCPTIQGVMLGCC
jgi:hypothetical protein